VLPAATAIEIAKEFQLTGKMSAAVSWFEL
jgi:hypothetical protein